MKIILDDQSEYQLKVALEGDDSTELYEIMTKDLPIVLELFAAKNRDYGGSSAETLGVKGQFADIWRKIRKLKNFLWDDRAPEFETSSEVLADLAGHVLLTLRMLRQDREAQMADKREAGLARNHPSQYLRQEDLPSMTHPSSGPQKSRPLGLVPGPFSGRDA